MSLPSKSAQLEAEFSARCEELRLGIEAVELTSLPEVRAHLEAVRELLAQGTEWWTKYDVRRNSEKLLSLEKEVDVVTKRLKPRRRFRFSQAMPSETPEAQLCHTSAQQQAALPLSPLQSGIIVGSSSVRNGRIELNRLDGKPLTLIDLKDVCVSLKGTPTALRLINLIRCDVRSVVVNGSVFTSGCTDCNVSVVCHQLRIHQSSDCSLWTCTESGPIIEGCERMRFGELRVEGRRGCWDDVKDFSWLREDRSPNWQLLNDTRIFQSPPL